MPYPIINPQAASPPSTPPDTHGRECMLHNDNSRLEFWTHSISRNSLCCLLLLPITPGEQHSFYSSSSSISRTLACQQQGLLSKKPTKMGLTLLKKDHDEKYRTSSKAQQSFSHPCLPTPPLSYRLYIELSTLRQNGFSRRPCRGSAAFSWV